MNEVAHLKDLLKSNAVALAYVESRLAELQKRKQQLTMELNRARRLERGAKELLL